MATPRSSLSRAGIPLGPHELVLLKNGTVLPAGVYQALAEAYVELMRRNGVLTPGGGIDSLAMLDLASIRTAQNTARRESAAARAPRPVDAAAAEPPSRPAPVPSRPPVPVQEILSFEGRYNRAFGDPGWIQVDVDARSFAAGSGSGGHLGAELDVAITLPGLGRKAALKEEMDVAVLWDICSTRSAVDPIGPDARVALHPTDLHSVTPWQARQTLGRMQIDAFGVPVDLWVDMVGTAGVSARGSAHSAYDDMTVAGGIMEASLGTTPVSVDEATSQGAYAKLRLVGTGHVGLTLRAVVQLLSRVEPTLPQRIEEIVAELPALSPWSWDVAEAGATLDVEIADLELRAEGRYSLDFLQTHEQGRTHVVNENYVHAGSIDTRLSARVLTDPSVQVFFALSAPDGVDVSWGFAPLQASWPRLAEPYPVWGWRGPLFEREVSVLDKEWKVDLGPGARPHFDARLPATNGV